MPSVPMRWVAAKRIVEMIREHPLTAGALVESAMPGDKRILLASDTIWLDEIAGTISTPLMMAGRLDTDDMFTIPILWTVRGRLTFDDCNTRLAEIMGIVHDVVVETACLSDLDGVVSATPGESEARTTAIETPSDGILGYGIYPVDIHARLN